MVTTTMFCGESVMVWGGHAIACGTLIAKILGLKGGVGSGFLLYCAGQCPASKCGHSV